MEIEKKFLIQELPENLDHFEKKVIEQGYLCTNPVVRIRKSNENYILTYKSRQTDQGMQNVCVNQEIEMPLNKEGYEHLRKKADGNLIAKTRYIVPLETGHTGELDIFEGALKGLVFIEVEFASTQEADQFVPPPWFGENVSDDHRYSNSFLSGCHDLSVFKEQ